MKASPITRVFLCTFLAFGLAGECWSQSPYPGKPIRIISPNAPGGLTSVLGRMIGEKLTESWGQPALIDSRAGGNGLIGGEVLAKSPPDGHTLMVISSTHIIVPLLIPAPYDPINGFTPIATICATEFLLVLHPSVPAHDLEGFTALARSRPGQLNFASSGSGAMPHLAGELFGAMRGIRMQHVPYKGSAPALTDLLGGQVQLFFSPPKDAIPFVKDGRLKALAVSGDARLPALPDVPTFTESGLAGFEVKTWFALIAPAGVSREVVNKLSTEIARILRTPGFKERLSSQGLDVLISNPDQLVALMKSDTARFSRVIKSANIKLEN